MRLVRHGPVQQQSKNDSGVLSPGPSLRQKNIHKVQRMTAGTIPGTGMTIVINGPMCGRVITMATDGFMLKRALPRRQLDGRLEKA